MLYLFLSPIYYYTYFCPYLPTISIPILYKNTKFHSNWVLFYNNLLKIHPIYVNWAPLSLMNPTRSLYTKICEKAHQKGRHIQMSVWESPWVFFCLKINGLWPMVSAWENIKSYKWHYCPTVFREMMTTLLSACTPRHGVGGKSRLSLWR